MRTLDILAIHNYLVRKYKKETISEADEDDKHFYFYLVLVIPILDDYCLLQKQEKHLVFHTDKTGATQNSSNHDEKRNKLVMAYIDIVSTYFPTDFQDNDWANTHSITQNFNDDDKKSNLIREVSRFKCVLCENYNSHFCIHDNHYVCEKCGYVASTTHGNMSYRDIDRVNISSKYTYDRRTHFRDSINQFQGKQNATIDAKVYSDLIEHFLSHGLIPSNYNDLPREEAFRDVHKEHVLLFLKETGHTKHYEDVVLIFNQLTHKPAPDISHLENDLLRDFDMLAELYDKKYKTSSRKNFINTQYVLYQLLRRHKYPCRKEDFNILKTIDRKYYHDMICQELFETLGWNFQALF